MIAAAAPTPGGLGALEAGLVAGFTGVGLDPGIAVAAVLSYRLVDLLAADPARLDQLPRPRAPQPHLGPLPSFEGFEPRRGGRPSPPRPSAHLVNVPRSRPMPAPPTTSRGRWTPP